MTLGEVPVSGRRAYRPVFEYLHHPERHPGGSERELDVLRTIRSAGLTLPEQQWRVRLPGGGSVRLDYAYPEIMEALEFMGFDPHGRFVTRFHRDAARTRVLQQLGWRLWPITAWTTSAELLDVASAIEARLVAHRRSRPA